MRDNTGYSTWNKSVDAQVERSACGKLTWMNVTHHARISVSFEATGLKFCRSHLEHVRSSKIEENSDLGRFLAVNLEVFSEGERSLLLGNKVRCMLTRLCTV